MEMEKPKPKHKKKKKVHQTPADENSFVEDVDNDFNELNLIDIDFPNTSLDAVPVHECSANLDTFEVLKNEEEEKSVEEEITSQEPVVETVENEQRLVEQPSAPEIDLASTSTATTQILYVQEPVVAYPNLESIKTLTEQLTPKTLEFNDIKLKPYTDTQIQQLYSNPQLKQIELFETEFIIKELYENQKQVDHNLYQLLKKYARCRADLKLNLSNLNIYKKSCNTNYTKVWSVEKKFVYKSGNCDKGHVVRVMHQYEEAKVNEDILETLSDDLKYLLNVACFEFTKNSYDSELYKLQIDQIITDLLNHSEFNEITTNSRIALNEQIAPKIFELVAELRLCVSILFLFLRDVAPDKRFTKSVRTWVTSLVSLQLRLATWQDHLFILYHALRCPASVGNWAASLIQIPCPMDIYSGTAPFTLPEFQHCVALMSALLLPIKERSRFLERITKDLSTTIDPVEDDIWVLVDSDGEEGNTPSECAMLKENDLVAFIDQIPLEMIFRFITFSERKEEDYELNEAKVTGHHLVKCIAFATNFIGILKRGLVNYDSERYKQFAKRLGRLTKMTIYFVADLIKIYKSNASIYKDPEEGRRIQVEFDSLVVRASNYIYESQKMSLWQYLMDFPYQLMDINSLWKLYFFLHVGDFSLEPEYAKIIDLDSDFLVDKFNYSITDVASDDLYFLLQSFSQMGLSRSKDDWDFIKCVTMNLLKIGFINKQTREICYKTVKDSLFNIVSKYPELVSDILKVLKNNLRDVGSLSPYLCKALPLSKWMPGESDLEILASWLLNFCYDSIESTTARVMFSNMNWNSDSNDELFLSYDLHVRMAFLVCEVYMKHVNDAVGSGIQETMRIVSTMSKAPTQNEKFSIWCWNMVSVLRLHFMDQNQEIIKNVLNNTTIMFQIPEIEKTMAVYQAYSEHKPLGVYCSLLISQIGHSVPQICHKGFDQLKVLLNDYRYSKVIRCLELMTPLFIDCPDSLHSCDSFNFVLNALVNADRTYLKVAKAPLGADGLGPILNFFGNMLQAQLTNYAKLGMQSPFKLINLWVPCFTNISNWNKDTGVVYLLDLISRVSYQFPDCWFTMREHFRSYFLKSTDIKVPKPTGLLNLITGSSEKDILSTPSEDAVWLSLMFLQLEFEVIEVQTGFWALFLSQLHLSNTPLVNILKKSLASSNISNFPPECLAIYKFATLITKTPPKHFLYPILCQEFFMSYLARVPIMTDARFYESYGVQEKFYEGDVALMKKFKKALSDGEVYYNETSLKTTDDFKKRFYAECARLFKTYLAWLEETQLNKFTQQNISLPPQYDIVKLKNIFSGNRAHWMEYVLFPEIRETQKHSINSWLAINYRTNPAKKVDGLHVRDAANDDPKKKIFERLKMFQAPVPPPELVKAKSIMGEIDTTKSTLYLLRNEYKVLVNFSRAFNLTVKEHKSLDGNYKDMVTNLYRHDSAVRMVTGSCGRSEDCSGGQTLRVEFKQAKLNEHIQIKLEENRHQHLMLLEKEVAKPEEGIIKSNFTIQNIIGQLLKKYRFYETKNNTTKCEEILQIATSFFYEILHSINEDIQTCPITQELCRDSVSHLGSLVQQNHEKESLNLLKLALSRPTLVNLIADLFTPAVCPPKYFLEMYAYICDSKRCDSQLLFVLLSKFDINRWLSLQQPKPNDVVTLLQIILKGLQLWNNQNSELLSDLLRHHLINIFDYQFPQYFDQVIQNVLVCFAAKRLKPDVLLDLLNSFYRRVGCNKLEAAMKMQSLKLEFRNFASKQNFLGYQDLQNTISLLSKYFQSERLQHGLHGLYPIYGDYCDVLALLLGSLGHAVIVSAIHAFPGVIADQLINWLWPCLSELFSPWLIPYYPQTMKDSPANWIQQFTTNSPVLLPWSDLQQKNAHKMSRIFHMTLEFLLEMMPASNLLLSHIFVWYDTNFANKVIPNYVLNSVHNMISHFPWERFRPAPIHMEGFNRILLQYVPECHVFVGNIYLRIAWTPWLQQNLQSWDYPTVQKMLSFILTILIKLSYEPKVRESIRIMTLLQEALKYPWHLLEYQSIESVFDWFVMSTDPATILRKPSEQAIDTMVLKLLQTVAAITPQNEEAIPGTLQSQTQAKRILYVRSIVRLLNSCGSKMHQQLTKKDVQLLFQDACTNLLHIIGDCFEKSKSSRDKEMEIVNLMFEIIGPMETQSDVTAKLFTESIMRWMNSGLNNLMLGSVLGSMSFCKSLSLNVCCILETAVLKYLNNSLDPAQTPTSWQEVQNKVGFVKIGIEPRVLIQNDLLFVLHLQSYTRFIHSESDVEKVTYLQNLQQHLADYKTTESNEGKLVLLWGFSIVSGGEIMKRSNTSKNQLLILARYFQMMTQQTEGWGEGLLGAIGLKKDGQTNKKKILSRCLSCAIFSLFSDNSSDSNVVQLSKEYQNCLSDLKSVLSNKKYADVRTVSLQAISLIESNAMHMLDNFSETIVKLIHYFYEEPYLKSILDFWNI